MRRTFLKRVGEMIRNEEDTVFYTVDMGMWALREELKDFPERCKNIGIFEDGMLSMVAGMSKRGIVATIFGIQPYLIDRTLEQIKMDFAYQKLGVNIVGTGAAVDYSKYGYSHYCPEDVQLVKMIPGCEFVAPGSAKQFLQLFNAAYRDGKPTFYRISDHPSSVYDPDVCFGQAKVMKEGKKATVIAVSVMLDMVMSVCADQDVTVLYYTTLEPFDYETLSKHCPSKKILVVEPEYEGSLLYDIHHGMGSVPLQIDTVGFPHEIFRNYGTYQEKMEYYRLTENSIRTKLDDLIR
ncbi:alpha-ketoacid dehydrogenase subunit beta [Sporofaciens musculi]|uniref:alpha-ketoacid dehydrogenase subunit beta n=1 Tax=Sporofaciens musculi TaxID=2681861 RepID=UPI00258C7414|nr:alpha-ketoacid dehydrogenase subunit beta [Sporofaciens musculi]